MHDLPPSHTCLEREKHWSSFLMGVVGQSQPSVRREGPNRVRWPVSKKPMSTKPIVLRPTTSVQLA